MSAALLVADAGPLIALASIDRLDLLQQLFGTVIIPEAVREETAPSVSELPAWIKTDNRPLAGVRDAIRFTLDPGERDAIALALAVGSTRILMDDRSGRKAASMIGLDVIGTFGVVALARRRGVVEEARPLLDALVRAGAFVSFGVYSAALADAGEDVPDQLPSRDRS